MPRRYAGSMPYRTGRHNRRQLIYRLPAELPTDTPADDERWTLALVITDPHLASADVVNALNTAEAWRNLNL